MKPKEKAFELVDKFMEHTVEWDNIKELAFDSEFHAKQCALIAVQELIDQCHSYREIDLGMSFEYWEEVKQEIEKL